MARYVQGSMETMHAHLSILRNYARVVLEQDKELTWVEEEEKAEHLREYLSLGSSLNWSEKELVTLLLREAICP